MSSLQWNLTRQEISWPLGIKVAEWSSFRGRLRSVYSHTFENEYSNLHPWYWQIRNILCIIKAFYEINSIEVIHISVQRQPRGGGGDGGLWGVQCLQHIPEPRARLWLPEEFRDWRKDQQDPMAATAKCCTFLALHQWWDASDTGNMSCHWRIPSGLRICFFAYLCQQHTFLLFLISSFQSSSFPYFKIRNQTTTTCSNYCHKMSIKQTTFFSISKKRVLQHKLCLISFRLWCKCFIPVKDKTIKLWKVSERDKRPEGYNLKDEEGRLKDMTTITSLQVCALACTTRIWMTVCCVSDC